MANTDDPAWIGSHWEEMYNDIYDDINELLDDMVYDDNDMYESEDPTWISRVREEMAPHQALAAFHLVCFAITPFVSTGLFRHVYLMKSATWSLAALLAISAFANLQLLFDAQVTDHQAATVGIVLRRLQAMSLALDEFLTAILLHELFACVTKAEIRPYDAGATWKKTASAVAAALLIGAALEGVIYAVGAEWWREILAFTMPLKSMVGLGVTCAAGYWGYGIAAALRKSADFRRKNAEGAKTKVNAASLLVVGAVFFQICKLLMKVAVIAMSIVRFDQINRCQQPVEESAKNTWNCRSIEESIFVPGQLMNNHVIGVFEMIAFYVTMIYKKSVELR